MAENRFGWSALPGALLKKWPCGAEGEPVAPAFLTHCKCNDMEDQLIVNMLSAYGIPALCVHPGDGAFGQVVLGMSGTGTDILVPEILLDDAKALMEAESDEQLHDGI